MMEEKSSKEGTERERKKKRVSRENTLRKKIRIRGGERMETVERITERGRNKVVRGKKKFILWQKKMFALHLLSNLYIDQATQATRSQGTR